MGQRQARYDRAQCRERPNVPCTRNDERAKQRAGDEAGEVRSSDPPKRRDREPFGQTSKPQDGELKAVSGQKESETENECGNGQEKIAHRRTVPQMTGWCDSCGASLVRKLRDRASTAGLEHCK